MVLSRALRVLLLCFLSLYLRGTEATDVDQNTLAFIISYINKWYNPGEQFAVAINIPASYCTGKINTEDLDKLLDDPYAVVNDMIDYGTYLGKWMIGATTIPDSKSPVNKETGLQPNLHSEYLLLKDPDQDKSATKNLLNKDKEGCVIFYTYNSPCDQTCLNKKKSRNILETLTIFKEHKGPKAFVYNRVFKNNDVGIKEHGVEINNNVPLYRCYSVNRKYECHRCIQEEKIVEKCLARKRAT